MSHMERKVEKLSAARRISGFRKALLGLALAMLAVLPGPVQSRESRYASIVMDYETGNVLYAVNPDRRSYPASLTKVMTLYLLFDALDQGRVNLNSPLPVSLHASKQSPSKLNLRPGDTIAVEDAVLALVTKSANDVAVVVAEALGGSEDRFADMMTAKARQLGMAETTYQNASGLPNLGQVSTPRDQALLGRALIRNHGKYYHYFATRQFKFRGQPISTHNRLMLRYQGADGIKTGYINASGFNLISSAKRDGRRIVGVVFGGDTAAWRDRQMANILDKGFARLNGGVDIRSASVQDEDRQDLDKLIATAKGPAAKAAKGAKREPVKLAAARSREEAGDAEPDWSIQVGAFADNKAARRAANAAAKRLGGLVAHAKLDVDKAKQGSQILYRARLSGFTEDEARLACKRLAKSKQACKVVQPSA